MLAELSRELADYEAGRGGDAEELPEPPPSDRVHTQTLLWRLGLEGDRQTRGHAQRLRRVMEALGWRYRRGVRIGEKVAAGYVSPDTLS